MFTIPAERLADAQRAHNENVWSYRLSWRTPILDGNLGACHALDIPLMFDRVDLTAFLGENPPAQARPRDARRMGAVREDRAIRTAATCRSGLVTTLRRVRRWTSTSRSSSCTMLDSDVRTTWEGVWAHN